MIKKYIQRFYLLFIIILLYAPIITLMALSFNSSKSRARWGGFTAKWYVRLFQDDQIMTALYTTLEIALLSALIATVLGTAGAIGIHALRRKYRTFMMGVTNIPMLNADIVTGISLMLLFIAFRFSLGFSTILIAHITFNLPYVILSVMPRLKQTNICTYEAALDLGASPLYAFFKVVFPDILPGVSSGFLLAFTMSLDDFVITHFTKGPGVDTLSTKIYSEVRKGIRPEIYALSTIMFLSVLLLLILVNIAPDEKEDRKRILSAATVKRHKISRFLLRKVVPAAMVIIITIGGIFYSTKADRLGGDNQVIVYNWGEYLDPDAIEMFEEETGIDVVYEEYETNEIMYPKIQSGAIATTISHDSHNIIAAGDNDRDILCAVRELERIHGGYVIASGGKVVDELPLAIGGLMSVDRAEAVQKKTGEMVQKARSMGVSEGVDPFITLSFMALTVIPELRLTEAGMFDVTTMQFIEK